MVNNSLNINNESIIIEHKNTTTYDVDNSYPGFGQGKKCGGDYPVYGIHSL